MGWLLAVVFGTLLYSTRKRLNVALTRIDAQPAVRPNPDNPPVSAEPANKTTHDLVVLRLQLKRLRESGGIDEERYAALTDCIDDWWAGGHDDSLPALGSAQWWTRSDTAWNVLTAHGLVAHEPPPWPRQEQTPRAAQPKVGAGERPAPPPAAEDNAAAPAPTAIPAAANLPAPPVLPQPVARPEATARDGDPWRAPPVTRPVRGQAVRTSSSTRAHAWQSAAPAALEKAFEAVSGWPRLAIPFLIQNIGWFIGAFLFLGGSVFLVTYTTGFTKAAIVFASLFAYTVFLVWGGYKLRQRRPELTTGSGVLLTTGLLLAPLSISAATRLMSSAGGSPLLWAIALAAIAVCLGAFYLTAQLVTGVVHRSLHGDYARLFLALASIQLSAPLLALWPRWPVLAALHLLLLGLLAYGLLRFSRDWLRSIFVDRQKTALFAAGSLLYAALTSFVHLTWGVDAVGLPAGYFAPYLMIVCGLLFYLDAQFKVHAHRHTSLTRFSFLVYGLSVVAVVLALEAPAARMITLALATALYALVLWKYLTLIPLYLMLASLSALYGFEVLGRLPPSAHLLAALPGLFGLALFGHWATAKGRSKPTGRGDGLQRVGLAGFRATLLLLSVLGAWSLAQGEPGLPTMLTGIALAGSLWWLLREAPGPVWPSQHGPEADEESAGGPLCLMRSPWTYGPIAALTLGLGYAPLVTGLIWTAQLSLVLLLLAGLWTALLVHHRRPAATRLVVLTEVYANSALLSLVAGTALAALMLVNASGIPGAAIVAIAIGAGLLLTLSLNLYLDWLFYGCLVWGAAAATLFKLAYLPHGSVGLAELLAAGGLWCLLWWIDRQPEELSAIARRRAWRDMPARLLWLLPGASETVTAPEASIVPQTMSLPRPAPPDIDAKPPARAAAEGGARV